MAEYMYVVYSFKVSAYHPEDIMINMNDISMNGVFSDLEKAKNKAYRLALSYMDGSLKFILSEMDGDGNSCDKFPVIHYLTYEKIDREEVRLDELNGTIVSIQKVSVNRVNRVNPENSDCDSEISSAN